MAITQVHGETQIKDTTIKNAQVATDAAILTSKLADGAEIIMRDGSVPFTGNVDCGTNKVINVTDPVDGTDGVPKGWLTDNFLKLSNFVKREEPNETPNDVITQFTLDNTPLLDSEHVYINGLLQEPGASADYTISGAEIDFNNAPKTLDKIRVSYCATP